MPNNNIQDISLTDKEQEKLLDSILNKIKKDKKIEYANLPSHLEQWKIDLVALEMVNNCLYNINLNKEDLRKLLEPTAYKEGAGSAGVVKEFNNELLEKLANDIFPYILHAIAGIRGSAYTTLSELNSSEPDKPSRQARLVADSVSPPLSDRTTFLRQARKTVKQSPSKITISSSDKSLKIGFESEYYSQNKLHLDAIALILNNRPETNEELANDIDALIVSSKKLTSPLVTNPAGQIENFALSVMYSHMLRNLQQLNKVGDIIFDKEMIEGFLERSDNQELMEVYERTIAKKPDCDAAKVMFIKCCLEALCLRKANDESSKALCKYVDYACKAAIAPPRAVNRPGMS